MIKAAILIGGGLGDCIWGYFNSEYNRKLKSVLELQKDLEITCYVHSINNHAAEILRYNPYINKIIIEPYKKICKREIAGLHQIFNLANLPDDPMDIFLNEEERYNVEKIKSIGDYVVIHPFAGEPDRSFANKLPEFISKVSKHYTVVVIGGNSVRNSKLVLNEEFDYASDRVINLVNQGNVRVFTDLVKGCRFFIGSHSAYMMAAFNYKKPALILVPDSFPSYLMPNALGQTQIKYPYVDNLFIEQNYMMFFNQIPVIDKFIDKFLGINEIPKSIPIFRSKIT